MQQQQVPFNQNLTHDIRCYVLFPGYKPKYRSYIMMDLEMRQQFDTCLGKKCMVYNCCCFLGQYIASKTLQYDD